MNKHIFYGKVCMPDGLQVTKVNESNLNLPECMKLAKSLDDLYISPKDLLITSDFEALYCKLTADYLEIRGIDSYTALTSQEKDLYKQITNCDYTHKTSLTFERKLYSSGNYLWNVNGGEAKLIEEQYDEYGEYLYWFINSKDYVKFNSFAPAFYKGNELYIYSKDCEYVDTAITEDGYLNCTFTPEMYGSVQKGTDFDDTIRIELYNFAISFPATNNEESETTSFTVDIPFNSNGLLQTIEKIPGTPINTIMSPTAEVYSYDQYVKAEYYNEVRNLYKLIKSN